MPAKKSVKRTVTTRTSKSPASGSDTPTKKAPAKKEKAKSSAKKSTKKTENSAETTELIGLLSDLNPEEISWLLTQTRTIIYNHKVEEVNKAAKDLVEAKNRKPKSNGSGSTASSKKKSGIESVSIEPTGNGRSFVIIMGSNRLFISLKELKALVKLTQVTDNPGDASRRLFAWMDRERRDMVIDAAITGPGDPRLPPLFQILRDKFTVG